MPPAAVVSMHRCRSCDHRSAEHAAVSSGTIGPSRSASAMRSARSHATGPRAPTIARPGRAVSAPASGVPVKHRERQARRSRGASAAFAPGAATTVGLPAASDSSAWVSAVSASAPRQSAGPRPCRLSRLLSPVGPGRSTGYGRQLVPPRPAPDGPRRAPCAGPRRGRSAPPMPARQARRTLSRAPRRRFRPLGSRRRLRRFRPLKPRQIVRPARLGAGARQPLAAERLAADDGADLVAVDVGVADMEPRRDPFAPGRRCGCAARRSARSPAR